MRARQLYVIVVGLMLLLSHCKTRKGSPRSVIQTATENPSMNQIQEAKRIEEKLRQENENGILMKLAKMAEGMVEGVGIGAAVNAGAGKGSVYGVEILNIENGNLAVYCAPGGYGAAEVGMSTGFSYIKTFGCRTNNDYTGNFVTIAASLPFVVGHLEAASWSWGADLDNFLKIMEYKRNSAQVFFPEKLAQELQNLTKHWFNKPHIPFKSAMFVGLTWMASMLINRSMGENSDSTLLIQDIFRPVPLIQLIKDFNRKQLTLDEQAYLQIVCKVALAIHQEGHENIEQQCGDYDPSDQAGADFNIRDFHKIETVLQKHRHQIKETIDELLADHYGRTKVAPNVYHLLDAWFDDGTFSGCNSIVGGFGVGPGISVPGIPSFTITHYTLALELDVHKRAILSRIHGFLDAYRNNDKQANFGDVVWENIVALKRGVEILDGFCADSRQTLDQDWQRFTAIMTPRVQSKIRPYKNVEIRMED